MQITRKSQHIRSESYRLGYEWNDQPGAGFTFPCDQEGNIITSEMGPEAWKSYRECQDNPALTFKGVKHYSSTSFVQAQGRCSCGRLVELYGFTNTCECGYEYNSFGQLLAPRSQWSLY